jgi:hypothetical protein
MSENPPPWFARFSAMHPGYSSDNVAQPSQGATNHVTFLQRDGEIVVAKVFCERERKEREQFALMHWQHTGLVPRIIWQDDPVVIVMSYVPGIGSSAARAIGGDVWRNSCRAIGHAIGSLTQVPLSQSDRNQFESRFYGELGSLEAYLGKITALGRSICEKDSDFSGEFWSDSLDFIDTQLDRLLSEPRILYDQDVGNLHVEHGRFSGFFDLEMCVVGGASMQLGSSLGIVNDHPDSWNQFRAGWHAATGTVIDDAASAAAAAAYQLLGWREISRYLSYDGTPGSGYKWASPADPTWYDRSFAAIRTMLRS